MAPSDYRGVRSTAAIYGHLIHPMLVVFPIGSLVGALTTGRAFWGTFAMISRSLVGRRLGSNSSERSGDTACPFGTSWRRMGGDPGAMAAPFGIIRST